MMPESTAAAKDFRELAKELRPIEDPNLTPEEAKKQQIKKPVIKKSVMNNKGREGTGQIGVTTANNPEPDFEAVDLKKLKNRHVTPPQS